MSSSTEKKIIALIGGTGAIGRPIIAALSQTKHYLLRVLTRNTQSEQAKGLTQTYSNVELVEGNYSSEADVRKLLTSAYGAFCNTDIWSCGGFQKEIDYGKMIFDIAKELHVKHFVYSSLDYTKKLLAITMVVSNVGIMMQRQLSQNTSNHTIRKVQQHGRSSPPRNTTKIFKDILLLPRIPMIQIN